MPIANLTIISGRTPEQRRALMEKVTDAIEESLGAPRQAIRVIVQEVPAFHWSVGGEPKGSPTPDTEEI